MKSFSISPSPGKDNKPNEQAYDDHNYKINIFYFIFVSSTSDQNKNTHIQI